MFGLGSVVKKPWSLGGRREGERAAVIQCIQNSYLLCELVHGIVLLAIRTALPKVAQVKTQDGTRLLNLCDRGQSFVQQRVFYYEVFQYCSSTSSFPTVVKLWIGLMGFYVWKYKHPFEFIWSERNNMCPMEKMLS